MGTFHRLVERRSFRKMRTGTRLFDELFISKHFFTNRNVYGLVLSVQCQTSCGCKYNEGIVNTTFIPHEY
jgi:hypothetical protein